METLKDFMDKKAVADVLEQIAAFLELRGENPFRIRAFRTAARAIGSFSGDLRQGLEDGIAGGGQGRRARHAPDRGELVNTGRASMLEELREQIPPGLVEMLAISGLGVAKIRQIHDVLGIDSLPELEAAATGRPPRQAAAVRAARPRRTSSRASRSFARPAPSGSPTTPPKRPRGFASALARLPGRDARDSRG